MSITTQGNGAAAGDRLAAMGAWDPVEFHDVAGTRIALARRGRGPAVVCLHATGHGARDFEAFAGLVGDRFEVIAVDWPGQGRSPREAAPASAARYAQVLEELLPRVSQEPAIVVGCSIGGAAAIEVAARRPGLVRGLVLCDPGGLVEVGAMSRFATAAMVRFFRAGVRGAWWYPRAFAMYYAMVLAGPSARAQRDRIVAAWREVAPILVESWTSFGDPSADLREKASTIACPVLFAWAKQDRVVSYALCRSGVERVPNRRVEMFRGGHAAFLEDADRFADSFRAFAATLPSGTAAQAPSGPWKRAAVA